MKINLRGNKVAVQKIKKVPEKSQNTTFLVIPESDEYQGIIRYIGETAAKDLKEGQKVYFGTNFQNVKMNGTELCVMEDSQIYAIVQEE